MWKQSPATYVTNSLTNACKMGVGSPKRAVPTVSECVAKQNGSVRNIGIEISNAKLISTTNRDVLKTTVSAHSAGRDGAVKPDVSAAPQKRRMSFKNLKGLRLNTSLKPSKVECVETVPLDTPSTSETLCDEKSKVSVKDMAKLFTLLNTKDYK